MGDESFQGLKILQGKGSTHFRCGLEHAFGNPSFATDSNSVVLVDLLHELVLGHCLGGVIYMPALVSKGFDSLWADVFKEEELKVLVLHRVKDFWLTDVHGCATGPLPESVVKHRWGRGGDRDGYCGGGSVGGEDHILWLRHFVQMRVREKIWGKWPWVHARY
jgi:hypothetical protein